MVTIRPREREEVRDLVAASEASQHVRPVVDAADGRIEESNDAIRDAYLQHKMEFARRTGSNPSELPAVYVSFAERYLAAQRVIEQAVDAVHAELVRRADIDPSLAKLRDAVGGARAMSGAARSQADDLAERGEVRWAGQGFIGGRSTPWTRGE